VWLVPFLSTRRPSPSSPLFPYTTLFRSGRERRRDRWRRDADGRLPLRRGVVGERGRAGRGTCDGRDGGDRDGRWVCRGRRGLLRSEEHTSELQSRVDLVCRLLLEKKKTI